MVRLAIDAMGGDYAPRVVLEGTILACDRHPDLELILVGPEKVLRDELASLGAGGKDFEIVDAPQVVGMDESPVDALRKKPDSSIRRMLALLREGRCEGVFSAGNTGAVVAGATMGLGLLPGARRAGIAVAMPVGDQPLILMDVGANVQCKPEHLVHYAIMATEFTARVFGVENPTVGLLNVGEEEQKGNRLAKEANDLFRSLLPSYIGNVEGRDIFHGEANVVICDGFVGNIVLKVMEGFWEKMHDLLLQEGRALAGTGAGEHLTQLMRGLRSRLDYNEYGGAPLLGVNGTVTIGHGRSDAKAVANAIRWTSAMCVARVNEHIVQALAKVVVPQGE